MINDVLSETRKEMEKSIEAFNHDLDSIRTGRASTALVDHIRVDYYNTPTPLNQLALVSVPEAQLISIKPFDPSVIKDIERALLQSDIGITPNNDGKFIRLQIPPLTEERRRDLAKQVGHRLEEAKVSIRNHRRNSLEDLRSFEKEKMITEDDLHLGIDKLQELTDEFIKKAEKIGEAKKQEIMTI